MSATTSSTHKFKVHPTTLRYALPLSKFLRLPSNAGKEISVGLIIVGRGYQGEFGKAFRGEEDGIAKIVELDKQDQDARAIKPKALLVRSIPEFSSVENYHEEQEGWDLPSIPALLGTDQTLLETVARCAKEKTGLEVKEIFRFLGSGEYEYVPDVTNKHDVVMSRFQEWHIGGEGGRRVRRLDFAVKLFPGSVFLPPGWEGKWVDTEESWTVMKRISTGAPKTVKG